MGAKQEAVVREMLAAWGHGKHEPDVDGIIACFAPDAAWTLYMPNGPTIRGREALRVEIERQLQYVGGFMCDILHMASNDRVVIAEREDSFVRHGEPLKQYIAGVFEVNGDNLISSYRDYFDLRDFAEQTGANISAISGLEGAAPPHGPVPEATAQGIAYPLQAPQSAEQQLIQDFCDAWDEGLPDRKPDVDRIVSMMSPDVQWQLWMPGGPVIKGREGVAEEIRRQMQYATHTKCNVIHSVSTPNVVLQERSDWAVLHGRPAPHQLVAVYELDAAGLVSSWREYINTVQLSPPVKG